MLETHLMMSCTSSRCNLNNVSQVFGLIWERIGMVWMEIRIISCDFWEVTASRGSLTDSCEIPTGNRECPTVAYQEMCKFQVQVLRSPYGKPW